MKNSNDIRSHYLEHEPGEPNGEERKAKNASLTHCRNTFSGSRLTKLQVY